MTVSFPLIVFMVSLSTAPWISPLVNGNLWEHWVIGWIFLRKLVQKDQVTSLIRYRQWQNQGWDPGVLIRHEQNNQNTGTHHSEVILRLQYRQVPQGDNLSKKKKKSKRILFQRRCFVGLNSIGVNTEFFSPLHYLDLRTVKEGSYILS